MTSREADARAEVDEFRGQATSGAKVYRDIRTGEILDPGDIILLQDPVTKRQTTFSAPVLTAQEQQDAAAALRGALENGTVKYPKLARQLLMTPEKLWMLGEIQMMISPTPNDVSYDITADLMEGLTATEGQKKIYEFKTSHDQIQQLFWNEVGIKYGALERDQFISTFAMLSPEGANRVGAQALAWVDTHGIEDEESKQQLFLNISAWTAKEQEYEKGQQGIFGGIDAPQELVEKYLLAPAVNWTVGLLSGAEEAARRKGLSPGQQIAYQFGIEPPKNAGDFGWWELVSGGADAIMEIGGDPWNWAAGLGAGAKAVKTIPMAADATRAGRIVAAARSLLPKPLTGAASRVSGGRVARVTYSLGAKSVDELLEASIKNGVAADAMRLIQEGNISKFQRLYPAWGKISDDAIRTVQEAVESPEEFIEILKSDALNEVLRSGRKLADAEAAARASEQILRSHAPEPALRMIDDIVQGGDEAAELVDEVADEVAEVATTVAEPTITVRLPPRYLEDAVSRELDIGEQVKATKKYVEMRLTRAQFDELMSDAEHYVDMAEDLGREGQGIVASARAVVRKLGEIDFDGTATVADDVVEAVDEVDPLVRRAADLVISDNIQSGQPPLTPLARSGRDVLDIEELSEIASDTDAWEGFVANVNKAIAASGGVADEAVSLADEAVEIADETVEAVDEVLEASFDELLMDQNIPRDIRLQAARDRLVLNALNAEGNRIFILSEVPTHSKRVFSLDKIMSVKGQGRLPTGLRRVAARSSMGRIPDKIDLANTRKGTDAIRRLAEHFGLSQDTIDELVGEFVSLEQGARQDWVWDTFMRRLGRETGVPAFEHQLVQFYKGAGINNYSASGVDLLENGHRIPMLASQMSMEMPVPVDILNKVFARAQSISNRSRLARAMGFNGRGLGSTKDHRMRLVARLRHALGEDAEGLSNDQLYEMAYSMVSPNGDWDGRGIWAGKMLPKLGSWGSDLHGWFTKSMLVLRPIQWMWRVALLEEPIRAHLFNMPSVYSNPLQYMASAREAHYIWNLEKWAKANASWAQDTLLGLTKGTREEVVQRIDDLGMLDDIFPDGVPDAAREVRSGIEAFVHNAVYGRTRINKLAPVKRIPWAVKNRAHSIKTAEKALAKMGGPEDFVFADEAQEIAGRLVNGYVSQAVGASHRKLYQWQTGMSNDEAFTHGRVYGARLIEFVEDSLGRMALRRRAALLRGEAPDVTAHNVINSSRWQLIAPDLRLKYPDEVDDLAVAERYLDEMLATEIDHLFKPFADQYSPAELADILDDFVTSRRIEAALGDYVIDWDLRSANYGAGVRSVGDFTAAARHDAAIDVPTNLPAPSLDGRFMAEDDPGYPTRIANWVMQTFGEKATQTINRRPAWINTYKNYKKHLESLDVPSEIAHHLARDQANTMVNRVFFNMEEAPYYVARLNRVLPFFGATYEVVGTWAYKLPVAVGGYWPTGAGEFARKWDRLIDGLVNMGLLSRVEEEDGSMTITLNLVPPESDSADDMELGRALSGAGYAIMHTLEESYSTLLKMAHLADLDAGRELRGQGYRLAVGHPLSPTDYGVLSFIQADIGLNPATNVAVTALAGRIPGATGPYRMAVEEGTTLADAAEKLGVDVEELVRYNREIFVDLEGFGSNDLYNGLLTGEVDPETLVIPVHSSFNVPGSSLWDAMSDTFMPFGEISNPHEFLGSFIPGTLKWVWAGIGLQNQPTDEFWKDSDLKGIFGGALPAANEAQAASQLNEAFMFMEAHDLVNGKGPFERITEKEQEINRLLAAGQTEEANAQQEVLRLDVEAFLDRAQKIAAESLILRGLTGSMLPTSPGHVRLEEQKIQDYWATKDYADSLIGGEGEIRLKPFKTMDDFYEFKEQLAAWLNDPSGDRARAVFRKNNPQLMAYLTPKTFYKEPVPDIQSYEEYQRQIETGARETSPLHVSMWRARSAAIQADYYNKYIATFGNDPMEAAAAALSNRAEYQALNEERQVAYQALEMWDDMHGGVYNAWREENYTDTETWAQDQINDQLNTVRDGLEALFELQDNEDIELDLQGIANLNSTIRGAIAEISGAISDYNELTDDTPRRNAYEQAIHRYFQEVYIPYSESIAEMYDKLPEVADSERVSLVFEQIKLMKNDIAGSEVFFDDDTTTPFPNPLEYSWQGKSKEEQVIKLQQWISRPVEWMDLDQATRLLANAPQLSGYIPGDIGAYEIYRSFTLRKIEVDEMFEAGEITRSQRTKAMKSLEEQLHGRLIEQGRGNEIVMSEMTPYEKLEFSGLLPKSLGIFGDYVRYYKQVLAQVEETPGTVNGRQIVGPLYDMVEQAFYGDPVIAKELQDLGINLRDETTLDTFLPYLFFGYTGER